MGRGSQVLPCPLLSTRAHDAGAQFAECPRTARGRFGRRMLTSVEQNPLMHRLVLACSVTPFRYPDVNPWTKPGEKGPIQPGDHAGTLDTQKGGSQRWKVKLGGRRFMAHNIIWLLLKGSWPADFHPLIIGHVDGDGANNAHSNLCIGTREKNKAAMKQVKLKPKRTTK